MAVLQVWKLFFVSTLIIHLVSVNGWRRRRRRRSPPTPPPPTPPPPTPPPPPPPPTPPSRPYIYPHLASWTRWHDTFNVPCSHGKSISRVRSIHSNYHEDRTWAFYCRSDYRIRGTCYYSGWKNTFDNPLTFQCSSGVITGVHSKYSRSHWDRVFDLRCCQTPNYLHYGCYWTPYLNNWEAVMDYTVPWNKFLVGVSSYHVNSHQDRRWKFLICSLKKFQK